MNVLRDKEDEQKRKEKKLIAHQQLFGGVFIARSFRGEFRGRKLRLLPPHLVGPAYTAQTFSFICHKASLSMSLVFPSHFLVSVCAWVLDEQYAMSSLYVCRER